MEQEFKVPENVSVHKQKQPRNWSYPLQTKEIVESLGLGELDVPVTIFYMNSPPRKAKDKCDGHFPIFSLSWHGHFSAIDPGPYFSMGVRLCAPKHRQRVRQVVLEEVFPLLKKWMEEIRQSPTVNSLELYYHKLYWPSHRPTTMGFEMFEDRDRPLFKKFLDLEEECEKPQAIP
jgi:hypothetical protein